MGGRDLAGPGSLPPIPTWLTERAGVDYPVIGAPMFKVTNEELAAAVSEAGALGCLATTNYPTRESLSEALERVRRLTQRPVGANLHLSEKFPWRESLRVCLRHGVKIIITSQGNPARVVEEVHAEGGTVLACVINLRQARTATQAGVDGLVAVGSGAGGHGGHISTMVLVPYLARETGLPVIAAGGVATGSQLAAALALGACGAVVGTRLIASTEAVASPAYKRAVLEAAPEDIVCTDRVTGNPANWIASSIQGVERPLPVDSPAWDDLWSAGQSVAQTLEIKGAKSIVHEIVEEYYRVVARLPGLDRAPEGAGQPASNGEARG